jgi:putative aldouronate transport system substrate-binding protein
MQTSYIRKDWLDKLGLPVPATTEEFYSTMEAFKEKDPGQIGKILIPYDFSAIYTSTIASPASLISSFNEKISEEDFYAYTSALNSPELLIPGYTNGVQFLNKMNAEG